MNKLITFVVILFLHLSSAKSGASQLTECGSNPPIPNIDGWNVVGGISRVDLRVTNEAVVYLGFKTTYNNPVDPGEFVKVTRRHTPLPISKPKPSDERLLIESSVVAYVQKEEQDLLTAKTVESDPILYIQWRTKENSRTGRTEADGDVNLWFMPADGSCRFIKNEQERVEFLTENVENGESHNVFSGMMYRVGDFYHIIRIDRDVLKKLLEGGK